MKQRFTEELDYVHEAENLRAFKGFHGECKNIRIPAVIDARSSRRVLTTEHLEGVGFDDACRADVALRTTWAETLWRFVFKGNLVHGRFNADPHPGNYLFYGDGGVGFLDFGCVQRLTESKQVHARALHLAAMDKDEAAFRGHARKLMDTKPGLLEDLANAYMRRMFSPLFDSPYRVERAFVVSLVEGMRAMSSAATKANKEEFFGMPTDTLFLNRLQFGFYSVLARLDVEVDYRRIERGFWELVPKGESARG